eukprot:TRINITY_DN33510_c0_g1_i1.p1 TRINITY_DN33510_c0_g1~~TRINITY_DN33510_c0_g1_i1.p1  ORF type:complete len:130 (+),score=44.65 TRINITY_DN33510_c0_g1_i1:26-391(+)
MGTYCKDGFSVHFHLPCFVTLVKVSEEFPKDTEQRNGLLNVDLEESLHGEAIGKKENVMDRLTMYSAPTKQKTLVQQRHEEDSQDSMDGSGDDSEDDSEYAPFQPPVKVAVGHPFYFKLKR